MLEYIKLRIILLYVLPKLKQKNLALIKLLRVMFNIIF
jgi:hypothetical protein